MAPTPSGDLHLGNALAFGLCWLSARSQGGNVLLRIEDIDRGRSRPAIAERQREDLLWLGLDWDRETAAQSTRTYDAAVSQLSPRLYRCVCTRKDRRAHRGFCGCGAQQHVTGALRFRLDRRAHPFHDRRLGAQPGVLDALPDPKLVQADGGPSYTLAVVADDIRDGVTEVVRGADLLDQCPVQSQLFHALGATPPSWMHGPVLLGPDGKKLSKSHGAQEVRALRGRGIDADTIWAHLLPLMGIDGKLSLGEAIAAFAGAQRAPAGPFSAPFSDSGT